MDNGDVKSEQAAIAAEKEAWNHTEDQHEETERQFDAEVAASNKPASAAKNDPKTTDSKGKPESG